MATSYGYSGSINLQASLKATASGDQTGSQSAAFSALLTLAASGGDASITGFIKGETVTCAAGDWLLAHASDPFSAMGDAVYSPGFTVAGSKLKLLIVKNTDLANSITITRKTSAGLPIFNADGDAMTLAPGDVLFFFKKAGTAALTSTTNDGLTISVSAGSPTCTVLAAYGS